MNDRRRTIGKEGPPQRTEGVAQRTAPDPAQSDLFEAEAVRPLLQQLIRESQLYRSSKDFKDLLDFVTRLRNVAPFNAMLLHIQKPGISYAASAYDWRERFGRTPKEGARPLLIMWPFGPVALVYDVLDTEGAALPEDVAAFYARGSVGGQQMLSFVPRLASKRIEIAWVDAGDDKAGSVRLVRRATAAKQHSHYRLLLNRNHTTPVQFATLVHELAHLFLGHLGPDTALGVRNAGSRDGALQELEAESVSYIVCGRNGVICKSHTYLAGYVKEHSTVDGLDLYSIMSAARAVEDILGLAENPKFERLPTRTLRVRPRP